MREYRWSLGGWLRGETRTSVAEVIAMLKGLPEDSKYSAHWQATLKQREAREKKVFGENYEAPKDERTEEEIEFDEYFYKARLWGSEDRKLLATAINVSREGNSYKETPPIIGPDEWKPDKQLAQERRKIREKSLGIERTNEGMKASTAAGFMAMLGQVATVE